jgi:hypothetical protein
VELKQGLGIDITVIDGSARMICGCSWAIWAPGILKHAPAIRWPDAIAQCLGPHIMKMQATHRQKGIFLESLTEQAVKSDFCLGLSVRGSSNGGLTDIILCVILSIASVRARLEEP